MRKIMIGLLAMSMLLLTGGSVCAEEAEETVSELGSVEEFQQWINSDALSYSTLNFVRRVGRIVGLDVVSFYSIMTIDGELAYCIEPGIYAATEEEYTVDWGKISEKTKQRLFRITNVGYGNFGHDGDEWFVATQLAIWRALGITHLSAQTMNHETWDVSWQVAEIERMADEFGDTASFTNQTLNMELGIPQTIVDTHGILSQFQVASVPGVDIVQNQNQLTLTITSIQHQKSISGSKGLSTGGLVYVHPGKQTVYMVHRSAPPVSYQLNLELTKGNLKLKKQDEFGNTASKTHGFQLRHENGELYELKGSTQVEVNNGELELELPIGTYDLTEVKTEYPYVLSDEVIKISIEPNQTTEVVFVNELEEVPLRIVKRDKDTLELLNGAQFTVHVQKDGKWYEIGSVQTGEASLMLKEGWENKTVMLYADSEKMISLGEFESDETGSIDVSELHTSGTVFIEDEEGNQLEKELPTGQGSVVVEGVKYGQSVQVCEVKAPEGYELSENSCQTIVVQPEKGEAEVVFENSLRKIDVMLYKVETNHEENRLNDALFQITKMLQNERKTETIIGLTGRLVVQVNDESGNPVSASVEIFKDAECTDLMMEAMSDERGELIVECEDSDVYVRIKGQQEVTHHRIEQGAIHLGTMKYGDVLRVCEVAAPSGFHLEKECKQFEIKTEDEQLNLYFGNERIQIYEEVPQMGID